MSSQGVDGRRARGDRTRNAILEQAMKRASIEGLDGLTIGRLADDVGVSKNNVTVLFGNREELQLATLDAAISVFVGIVVAPALGEPTPLVRLRMLCDGWFDYVAQRVFPGGCFLHAAISEYRARPGRLRTQIRKHRDAWSGLIEKVIVAAQANGSARRDVEAAQIAFELIAFQAAANTAALLGDEASFARAQKSTQQRIEGLARR